MRRCALSLRSCPLTSTFHSMRCLTAVVLAVILLAGCDLPGAAHSSSSITATPTATPEPPLARDTVYWSRGDMLFALRASDGQVRWKIGGWSVTLPSGN